jgi:hypothetical protein
MDTNGNINKLFVPYNLAVIAKEKGFDEACISWYWDDIGLYNGLQFGNHNKDVNRVSAPLYQQLIDWLREKHSLNIPIYYSLANGKYNSYSYCSLDEERETDVVYDTDYYSCLNKALEEVFKLI